MVESTLGVVWSDHDFGHRQICRPPQVVSTKAFARRVRRDAADPSRANAIRCLHIMYHVHPCNKSWEITVNQKRHVVDLLLQAATQMSIA